MKVFLGGTCDGEDWRKKLIPMLKCDYFDPLIRGGGEWTEECQRREQDEKLICDIGLYTITNGIVGVYSIAEVTAECFNKQTIVIFCNLYVSDGSVIGDKMKKSLCATEDLLQKNGAVVLHSLESVAAFINVGIQ